MDEIAKTKHFIYVGSLSDATTKITEAALWSGLYMRTEFGGRHNCGHKGMRRGLRAKKYPTHGMVETSWICPDCGSTITQWVPGEVNPHATSSL